MGYYSLDNGRTCLPCTSSCPSGYSITTACTTTANAICSDINECATSNGGCAATATCSNSIGSYTCTCNSGYYGNGASCSACLACGTGYAESSPCTSVQNRECQDVNECTQGKPPCATTATCTNTVGSYTCTCNVGYSGNGTVCTSTAGAAAWNGQSMNRNSILAMSGSTRREILYREIYNTDPTVFSLSPLGV